MEHVDAEGRLVGLRGGCGVFTIVTQKVIWTIRLLSFGAIVPSCESWGIQISSRARELISKSILGLVFALGHELGFKAGFPLPFSLEYAALLLRLLLHLGEVVLLGFPLRVFIQLGDHLIVVSPLLSFLLRLLNEMLIDDCDELIVPLIEDFRCDL